VKDCTLLGCGPKQQDSRYRSADRFSGLPVVDGEPSQRHPPLLRARGYWIVIEDGTFQACACRARKIMAEGRTWETPSSILL